MMSINFSNQRSEVIFFFISLEVFVEVFNLVRGRFDFGGLSLLVGLIEPIRSRLIKVVLVLVIFNKRESSRLAAGCQVV